MEKESTIVQILNLEAFRRFLRFLNFQSSRVEENYESDELGVFKDNPNLRQPLVQCNKPKTTHYWSFVFFTLEVPFLPFVLCFHWLRIISISHLHFPTELRREKNKRLLINLDGKTYFKKQKHTSVRTYKNQTFFYYLQTRKSITLTEISIILNRMSLCMRSLTITKI